MGARLGRSTLQGTHAVKGNYSSADLDVPGLGIGLYTSDGGDIEILPKNGPSVIYASVPAGTFMQVPLFKAILNAGTDATDIVVTYIQPPYA